MGSMKTILPQYDDPAEDEVNLIDQFFDALKSF